MYLFKVVISDDEIINCKGIRNILEKECPNTQITGVYNNGSDVIRHLEKNTVDILITDIRMPLKTGLDVAAYIREKNLDTDIIIITGYHDFEYAKKAINIKVSEFILKPIDYDEFVGHINKICESRTQNLEAIQKLNREFLQARMVEKQNLDFYLKGLISYENLSSVCNPSFMNAPCAIIKFDMHPVPSDKPETYWRDLLEDDNDSFNAYCMEEHAGDSKFLVFIKNRGAGNSGNAKEFAEYSVNLIRKLEKNVLINYYVSEYRDLTQIMHNACTDLVQLFIDYLFKDKGKDMQVLLETVGENYSFYFLQHFIVTLIDKLSERVSIDRGIYIEKAKSVSTVKSAMKLIADIETEIKALTTDNHFMLNKIKRYIYSNCHKNLSLQDVADKFHFNYSYLSRLFKKETGENFANYVMGVRIMKAQELLKGGKYPVEKVAYMVGYESSQYFYKVFKKVAGISPKSFASMSGEDETNE